MASQAIPERPDEVTPIPKPSPRLKATRDEWRELREGVFAFASCVACPSRYEHLHHIAFRKADGGDDILENLAPICHLCHETFHSRSSGWERVAAAIREFVCTDLDRWGYALTTLGEDKFDRRYPSLRERCEHCLLPAGHTGAHLQLTDDEFQPRRRDEFLPVFNPEELPFA